MVLSCCRRLLTEIHYTSNTEDTPFRSGDGVLSVGGPGSMFCDGEGGVAGGLSE